MIKHSPSHRRNDEMGMMLDRIRLTVAETRVGMAIERQIVQILDVFERIEGQLVGIQQWLPLGSDFWRWILNSSPGNAVFLSQIRVLFLPRFVSESHPIEW